MQIKNVKIYGLEESIIRSGYPMEVGEPCDIIYPESLTNVAYHDDNDIKRANKLSNNPTGSGHNNYLKGIIVQFDLQYPQYLTPQLQRYHWIDIISSQSKMHCITKLDLSFHLYCNKYVFDRISSSIEALIMMYNNSTFPAVCNGQTSRSFVIQSKEECFQYIISNLPMGYEMWMGVSTNYLQLKTIYNQRNSHKLEEWRFFCNWIETLPMSELITNKSK